MITNADGDVDQVDAGDASWTRPGPVARVLRRVREARVQRARELVGPCTALHACDVQVVIESARPVNAPYDAQAGEITCGLPSHVDTWLDRLEWFPLIDASAYLMAVRHALYGDDRDVGQGLLTVMGSNQVVRVVVKGRAPASE